MHGRTFKTLAIFFLSISFSSWTFADCMACHEGEPKKETSVEKNSQQNSKKETPNDASMLA